MDDINLEHIGKTKRVEELIEGYFKARPEICVERPKLITEYCLREGLFEKPRVSILDKARLYRYVLENKEAVVHHDIGFKMPDKGKEMEKFPLKDSSLFAGSTTSKFKGVVLYPEFLGLSIWPELSTISTRKDNPYHLDEKDAEMLNRDIFPYWMKNSILEIARSRFENDSREARGLKLMQHLVFFLATKNQCISHTIPDFSEAVRHGLRDMINKANKKKSMASGNEKEEFYSAIIEVLEGIVAYSKKLAEEVRKLAGKAKTDEEREELEALAKIHETVPEKPATTFREGLTTVWVCWIAIHLENPNIGLSPGRLDQPPLADLYAGDLENAPNEDAFVEKAVELVCHFWLKIGDHVPMIPNAGEQLFGGTGSNQAITIGGVRPDGKDAVTDLTYIMLRATELLKLRDPNLNARYHPETNSEEYLERLLRANMITGATPALHNDKAVINALEALGEKPEHARDYGVVGCVEPASNGRAYTASASILLNLLSILELTLYDGRHRHTGLKEPRISIPNPPGFSNSFNEFKDAFLRQLQWMADLCVTLNNQLGRVHQDVYPTPILSAFFKGPMDNGKDLIQGGAEINASGVTIIGLADTVDSLTAIQDVLEKDPAEFEKLIAALNSDFEGSKEHAAIRERLKETAKYGSEDKNGGAPMNNVEWLVRNIHETFKNKKSYRGDGCYRVGYWTMTSHAGFGRLTRATPNGRKSRENFASGVTPVSGEAGSLPPVLNSVAALPEECITSGMALNLKYTPEPNNKTMVETGGAAMMKNFMGYTKGYFADQIETETCGMEIQFNIRDREEFLDAVDYPEKHRDLLVRVSGYTAYFVDLNPRMQKEIIDRSEYLLSTGKLVHKGKNYKAKDKPSGLNLGWLGKIPITGIFADKMFEGLLVGMRFVLNHSGPLRTSTEGFDAAYVFKTEDGAIDASVIFVDGEMKVDPHERAEWDVRVVFEDVGAFLEYILSDDQDILNTILENKVEVEGNLNYLYRFGHLARMARDWKRFI